MSRDDFFVDLHCHPNIKAFNSGKNKPKRNLWENIPHPDADTGFMRWVRKSTANILKESQCNFDQMIQGNLRVANVSLYPVERGFLRMRNVPNFLVGGDRIEQMIEHITGMALDRVIVMKDNENRYFKDLVKEYEFVRDGQGPSPDGKASYQLVNNYTELQEALKKPNNIAVIIAIEGAHALGTSTPVSSKMNQAELQEMMTDHIRQIKAWEYPPFTMNMAHHFWNQLCGHSASFKRPMNGLVNQNKGKDRGFTDLGRHVMRELLSRDNGKRIIIDTKHMSVESRKEYYGFVTNYNYLNPADKIPVVCSHAGVNGYKDLDSSARQKDNFRKAKNGNFYKWGINLSNEELNIIHDSEGLVGIMMDKGMLGGHELIERISALKDLEKQRHEYCRIIWLNIFQIIKAVGKPTAWDVMAIGSDYDGIIQHVDPYEGAGKYPLLRSDLIAYLEETNLLKELWYGHTPKQLVDKFTHQNAMAFYKKFFV